MSLAGTSSACRWPRPPLLSPKRQQARAESITCQRRPSAQAGLTSGRPSRSLAGLGVRPDQRSRSEAATEIDPVYRACSPFSANLHGPMRTEKWQVSGLRPTTASVSG